jgi:hypothetical protein
MKLFGYSFGENLSVVGILLLIPLVIIAQLAIGGAVIYGVTNVWSLAIQTVDIPNPNYWESVLIFAGLWVTARMLDKS